VRARVCVCVCVCVCVDVESQLSFFKLLMLHENDSYTLFHISPKKNLCVHLEKRKKERRSKVLCQLGGCAVSHPLNFPQFHPAGVSRDRFDMRSRIFQAATSPSASGLVYNRWSRCYFDATWRVERCVIENIW